MYSIFKKTKEGYLKDTGIQCSTYLKVEQEVKRLKGKNKTNKYLIFNLL